MSDSRASIAVNEAKVRARLAGKSVLVTGGAGFLGGRLAHALVDLCDLTVLDDLTSGHREVVPDAASFVHGDVRDVETVERAMADAEVVFHMAALTEVERSINAPAETSARNVGGTLTVLDAARRYDVRVVFGSSAAVYGPPDSLPVEESQPKNPTSPYGIATLAADQYVRAYHELYRLPTVALRYFDIYGRRPNDATDDVSRFLRRAIAGDTLVLNGDGSETRDFVHVDDAVEATLGGVTADATGRAYNVGTGAATTSRELAEHVRAVTGSGSDIVEQASSAVDVDTGVACLDRARDGLGYEPRFDLESGLRSMVDRANETAEQSTPSS